MEELEMTEKTPIVEETPKYGTYISNGVEHVLGDKTYASAMAAAKAVASEMGNADEFVGKFQELLDLGKQAGGKYNYNSGLNIQWVVTPDGKTHMHQNPKRGWLGYVIGGAVNSKMDRFNEFLQKVHNRIVFGDDPEEETPTSSVLNGDNIILTPTDGENGFDAYASNTLDALKRVSALEAYYGDPEAWLKTNSFANTKWPEYITTLKDSNRLNEDMLAQLKVGLTNGRLTPEQLGLAKLFGINIGAWEDPAAKAAANKKAAEDAAAAAVEAALQSLGLDGTQPPAPKGGPGDGDKTPPPTVETPPTPTETSTAPAVSFRTHYLPGFIAASLSPEDSYADIPWTNVETASDDKGSWVALTASDGKKYYFVRGNDDKYVPNISGVSKLLTDNDLKAYGWTAPKEWNKTQFFSRKDGLKRAFKDSQENNIVTVETMTIRGLDGSYHRYNVLKNLVTSETYIQYKVNGKVVYKKISNEEMTALRKIKSQGGKSALELTNNFLAGLKNINLYDALDNFKQGGQILKFQDGGKGLVADLSLTSEKKSKDDEKKEHDGSGLQAAAGVAYGAGALTALLGTLLRNRTLLRTSAALYPVSGALSTSSAWVNSSLSPEDKMRYTFQSGIPTMVLTANAFRKTGVPSWAKSHNTVQNLEAAVGANAPTAEQLKQYMSSYWGRAGAGLDSGLRAAGSLYGLTNAINGVHDLVHNGEYGWTARNIGDWAQIIGGVTAPFMSAANYWNTKKINSAAGTEKTNPWALAETYKNPNAEVNILEASTPKKLTPINFKAGLPGLYDFYNSLNRFANPYTNPYSYGITPVFGNNAFFKTPFGPLNTYKPSSVVIPNNDDEIIVNDSLGTRPPIVDSTAIQAKKRGGKIMKADKGGFLESLNRFAGRWMGNDGEANPMLGLRRNEYTKLLQGLHYDIKNEKIANTALRESLPSLMQSTVHLDKGSFNPNNTVNALNTGLGNIDSSLKSYMTSTSDGGLRASVLTAGNEQKNQISKDAFESIGNQDTQYQANKLNITNQEIMANQQISAENGKNVAETLRGIAANKIERNTQMSQKFNDFLNTDSTWRYSNAMTLTNYPQLKARLEMLQRMNFNHAYDDDINSLEAKLKGLEQYYRYPNLT